MDKQDFITLLENPADLAVWLKKNDATQFIADCQSHQIPDSLIRQGCLDVRERLLKDQVAIDAERDRIYEEISKYTQSLEQPKGAIKTAPFEYKRLPIDPVTAERLPRLYDILKKDEPVYPQLENLLETDHQDLLKKFYPRCYEKVGAYHSPKMCSCFLAAAALESQRYGFYKMPTAYRLLMPSLQYMIERRMPMFFIAPDLLEAIKHTDFDGDINWVDMHLPLEHGVFVLPKGGLVHPVDGEVSMILWTRKMKDGVYPPPMTGIPKIEIATTAMSLIALCHEKAVFYDSTLTAEERPVLKLNNLFYRKPGEAIPQARQCVNGIDQDVSEEDVSFLEQIGVLVFGTFMAMNARPELLERERLDKIVTAKNKPRREFWSPNIIGKKYKLKKEVPRIGTDGKFFYGQRQTGSHASPRLHIRRGHIRQQACGPQWRERKEIWIEPTWVIPYDNEKGE